MGQLNELQIKAAQPRDKEYMLSDGEGLYLRVRPNGKVWIYRYKQAREQAKLSLGSYPTVTLTMARRKARDEAEKRAGGIDPRDDADEVRQRFGSTDGETVEVVGMCKCQAAGAAQLPLLDHVHGLDAGDQARSRAKRLESHHRSDSSFDSTVVLLHKIVQVLGLP